MGERRDRQYSEEELLRSISDLTRENIKLKDVVSYYETQVEWMGRSGEPPPAEPQ